MKKRWAWFLDTLFERGTGTLNYTLGNGDVLGRRSFRARHCGEWMHILRQYEIIPETGRRRRLGALLFDDCFYCKKCGFLAFVEDVI
jgi:hypothetical protein